MANKPAILATVTVTAKDIKGGNVAKQFNQVSGIVFDYTDGSINIIDATGSFYFPLGPMTTLTYTIVNGIGGQHTVVMS